MFNVGCWWLAIGVSRWSRPSLRGRGRGRGQFFSACSPCSQKGFCSSVKICEREKFQRAPCVLFSQNYTEEQNTQRSTETLSQPISQSVTANDGCNVLWYIAVNSVISVVCLQTFVGSHCSQKGFCSSVKICEREKFQRAPCVLFSQKNTEEQNTQGFTETWSQPMTQSVTAKDGCWVFNIGCWWLAIGVSRWSRPSLRGRGRGRGQFFSACYPCS